MEKTNINQQRKYKCTSCKLERIYVHSYIYIYKSVHLPSKMLFDF